MRNLREIVSAFCILGKIEAETIEVLRAKNPLIVREMDRGFGKAVEMKVS